MVRKGAVLRHNKVAVGLLLGRLGRCLAGETEKPRESREQSVLSLGRRWVVVSLLGGLQKTCDC